MTIRFAIDEVRKTGRAAQGVRLLNLASDGDRVVAIAKIDAAAQALDEESGDADAQAGSGEPDAVQPGLGLE
jgi:DNA gyrase subunit A